MSAEAIRALATIAEPPRAETALLSRLLDVGDLPATSEYTDVFVLQLPPYASVYLGNEGMLGGEARDRVAGFWRALGLVPPAEPDHLAALLGLYAELADTEDGAPDEGLRRARRGARHALLWEHLLSWLPVYLAAVGNLGHASYRRWALLLAEVLTAEAEVVGPPVAVSSHLREARPPADPRGEGLEAWLTSVLAPVRGGIILARADLARAGRELELGVRLGERRFMLRSLLGQDAPAALRWVAGEAERWISRHRAGWEAGSTVASFWADQARATAALCHELEDVAGEAVHAEAGGE